MFTLTLLLTLFLLSALALVFCAEEAEEKTKQEGSSKSKRDKRKPPKGSSSQVKLQSKVSCKGQRSGMKASVTPKKAAKESLPTKQPLSEVKSTGASYYDVLIKQCTVKSVSQYKMPPPR